MAERRLIVCADDFALSPGVSEAILKLVKNNRLSAVGCMTASQFWDQQAQSLKPMADRVDIGLHVTLTEQKPLVAHRELSPTGELPAVSRLYRQCLTNDSIRAEIRAEVEAQIERFVDGVGRLPDFIDGHHHVHQFPVIRDLIIDIIVLRYGCQHAYPYLRICSDTLPNLWGRRHSVFKALTIGALSRPLKRAARRHKIPTNTGFSGIYGFNESQYGRIFETFLLGLPDLGLVMCHPGFADDDLKRLDGLVAQREAEYDFLASENYIELLARSKVILSRYPSRRNPSTTRSEMPARS